MDRRQLKADLSLLKKYVEELEHAMDEAYKIRDADVPNDTKDRYHEFMISLAKAMGLLVGIGQESSLLVGDVQKIAQYSEPKSKNKDMDALNLLKNILSPKGGDNEN